MVGVSPLIMLDAVREERARRAAEGSLIEFTKQAWHIIEPTTEYRDNWHVHAIAEHLEAVSVGEIKKLLINIPPGCMKLCADSTIVPTPQGYTTHGNLKPGDYVFSPHGKPVLIKSITAKAYADYAVEFTNGEIIQCNGEHLWTVYDRFNAHKLGTYSVTELLQKGPIWVESEGRARYSLPDSAAIEFSEKELLLHPYFIGCWLGDGTSTKPCITHAYDDTEHIDKLERLGFKVTGTYMSAGKARQAYFARQGITQELRKLGLFNNKHIPECYATGSINQRLELLAGLIDTDGYVEPKRGRVTITSCIPSLVFEIERLVASLGFRFHTNKRKSAGFKGKPSDKDVYAILFEPNRQIPTAITRKQITRINALRRKIGIRRITKVQYPEQGHCISIDSPDGLYIVGHKHIVTHNSILVSVMWPAWMWIADASLRVLGASYGDELSIRDSQKTRDIITSKWFQDRWPHVQIVKGEDQKQKYALTERGWRMATSVGGRATGEHPDIKIVDDPHSAKQAHSEAERRTALNWFDATLSTRGVSRGAKTVVVMQRLHEQDVSGHIIDDLRDYEHLFLPMRYESGTRKKATCLGFTDPRTTEGSLLWPEMFPESVLQQLETSLGSYGTAGQLQQRPAPEGGGILKTVHFKLWPHGKPLPDFDAVIQSWDTAFTERSTGDPSACTVWGYAGFEGKRIALLLDASADTLAYPDLKKQVIDDWSNLYGEQKRHADFVLIEKKASGQSIIQDLRVAGIPCRPYNPGNADKIARAHMAAPILETGVIYLLESAAEPGRPVTWARKFVKECEDFPNGKHDDLCVARGTQILMGNGALKNIEDIAIGELVATPAGPKKVLISGLTGIKHIWELRAGPYTLYATGNHPVCTAHDDYVKINTLTQSEPVKCLSRARYNLVRLKSLYLMVRSIGATQIARISPMLSILQGQMAQASCTGQFGYITMGRYRKVTLSTIETKIQAIIRLKTLSACKKVSMQAIGMLDKLATVPQSSAKVIYKALGKGLSYGIRVLRAVFGTVKMLDSKLYALSRKVDTISAHFLEKSEKESVFGVVRSLWQKVVGRCFVAAPAKPEKADTVYMASARPTQTITAVYNLSVEDQHCYFANGILTHNCDTFTQATIYARDAGLLASLEVEVEEDDEEDYHSRHRVNPYGR